MRLRLRRPLAPHGPAGWQMAMIPPALGLAVSLLTARDVFGSTPVYRHLRTLPIPEDAWGVILGLYALGTALSLFWGGATARPVMAALGVFLWLFLGVEMLLGAWPNFVSGLGIAFVLQGLGSIVAVVQWAGARDAR